MKSLYAAAYISTFCDDYGMREWDRLLQIPADRTSFHIHTHYLRRYLRSGNSVLEAGAGPGRFTLELAELGARIVVGDISRVQLELNKQHTAEAGWEAAVESRVQLDITDLSRFGDGSFDAVVSYGGPLSYVMDRAETAIKELLRVTKPGGFLFVSVMSLLGATRIFLEGILTLENYPELVDQVSRDGFLSRDRNNGHPMKLYRYAELRSLLERHGCKVVAASATNLLTAGRTESLAPVDAATWDKFLAWELDFCAEEGALDCGTHILVVAQKDSA